MKRIKALFPNFIRSILNSYGQIFFSNDVRFAIILLLISFFDFYAGLCGLISVMISNVAAYLIGFNRFSIKSGYYGFNSLLVGLGIGVYFAPGLELFIVIFFASLLSLFITVLFEGVIGKYGLPFLSVAFLLTIWMVTLASREFQTLHVSERGIFLLNDLYAFGGAPMIKVYNWFYSLDLHKSIIIYFRSLGAIFFQYNIFAGILIALGLLIYSRLSFLLSLVGFFSAYYFYYFIGGNFAELSYGYIGFNFILTSIAIGGFFLVSSKYSFLWVILLTPLISVTITSTNAVLSLFQLSIYSLPFNFIVLLFLYMLKFRERFTNKPEVVLFQHYSPEKNLYSHINQKARFSNLKYFAVSLPFFGEWTVTQSHDGAHTHKGEWRHAWDFEIEDEEKNAYTGLGASKEDFYCYGKPVLSPADGVVEEIIDNIDDNDIADVNMEKNWGNTMIIKHADFFYSKLSHLKKESFKVKAGDFVKKGDAIAFCGNSGRSPQPHLHFQLQATPFIDSKTLDYPLGYYILKRKEQFFLQSFEKPKKDDAIANITVNKSLYNAFHFIPGQKMKFVLKSSRSEKEREVEWEIMTDIYNNSYINDEKTGSRAFFRNDGSIHYFTHFEGDKNSLLFYFYLGGYKYLSSFYKGLLINDSYPLNVLNYTLLNVLQDFISPFYIFLKADYTLEHVKFDDNFGNSSAVFKATTCMKVFKKTYREIGFEIHISRNKIEKFIIDDGNKHYEATLQS